MIKTLIIDDEERTRKTLKLLVAEYSSVIQVVGEAGSVNEGYNLIVETQPDLVLLDVEMPDGTGFNLISRFTEIDFELIFVTGHSDYAIKAIKISALDYILKPVQPYELFAALKKCEQKILNKNQINKTDANTQFTNKNLSDCPNKITLKTAESITVVNVCDIVRCESNVNYTCFYFIDGKKILVSRTLKEFEILLEGFGFMRVHQSHLINLIHISRFDKNMGRGLYMKDNSFVPVSLRKKDEVLKYLAQFSK